MEKIRKTGGKPDIIELIGMAFFALCAMLTLYTAFVIVPVLIESDSASDMLQARFAPFWSADWYFANGLNVLNFQWLRWLLLRFVSDWGVVRGVLFVLSVGLTLLCAYYLMLQLGLGRKEFWLVGAALMFFFILQPNEKQQYATILSCTFLAPALLLRVCRECQSSRGRTLALAALLLLAFIGGISATRLMISLFLPMLLAAFLSAFICAGNEDDEGNSPAGWLKRPTLEPLVLSLLTLAASLIGIIIARKLIWPMLNVEMATGIQLLAFVEPQPGGLMNVTMRYFALFGYTQGIPVVSRMGIGNLCALLLGAALPVLTVLAVARARRAEDFRSRATVFIGCFCFTLFITAFFPMLFTTLVRFDRYYLPACAMFAVMLAVYASQRPPVPVRRMLTMLALCLALCYAVLSAWRTGDGDARYIDRTAQDQALSYLKENKYTLGYAPYWHASVNTERTNGEILIAPISANADETDALSISAYHWLTPCHAFDSDFMRQNGTAFLLLPTEDAAPKEKWDDIYAELKERLDRGDASLPQCTKVFENPEYTIYELPSGICFAEDGKAMPGA